MHLFIGDGHYQGEAEKLLELQALLDKAQARGLKTLSILGDYFQLWLGCAHDGQAEYEDFLRPLFELKAQGVFLRYVVGNKDFGVQAWNQRRQLFDEILDPDGLVESKSVYLAHGDLLNEADRPYRVWRAVVRNPWVNAFFFSVPAPLLRLLGTQISSTLEGTNQKNKSTFPRAYFDKQAQRLPQSVKVAVYGHFHRLECFKTDSVLTITLPFLWEKAAGVYLDEEGVASYFSLENEYILRAEG